MHTKGKFVLILLIMIHSIGNACSSGEKRVRMPAVAGAFYPAKADTLRKMIASFMSDASSVEFGCDCIQSHKGNPCGCCL